MPSCEQCGTRIEAGDRLCPACAHHGDPPPARQTVGRTAPSLLPLTEIQTKIKQLRFIGDGRNWWARWGVFVGAPVGMVVAGVVLATQIATAVSSASAAPGVGAIAQWLAAAVIAALAGAGVGALSGVIVALLIWSLLSFIKPVLVALFRDPAQFEREYGPASIPKRTDNRSSNGPRGRA